MEALLIRPQSKEQVKAFEQMAKALKIPFEKIEDKSPYNPEFVAKILKGDADIKAGRGRKITIEELDALWK